MNSISSFWGSSNSGEENEGNSDQTKDKKRNDEDSSQTMENKDNPFNGTKFFLDDWPTLLKEVWAKIEFRLGKFMKFTQNFRHHCT